MSEGSTFESWTSSNFQNLDSGKYQQQKKSFYVAGEDVAEATKTFEFAKARNDGARWDADGSSGERVKARELFTPDKWNWLLEVGDEPVGWRRPTYRSIP